MQDRLIVSISPHLHKRQSAARIMWMVVLSLLPAGMGSVFIFGREVLWVITLAVASALITECAIQLLTRKKVTVLDGSAFLTGLLLAYTLPPKVPFWMPVVGSFFAIAIGKQAFGGLGRNIFNPALVGRVFLMASWPRHMTGGFTLPFNPDAVSSATALAMVKDGKLLENISYLDLFLGRRSGCIGEVCILALILGAVFLLVKGHISWHIPIPYIFTVGLLTYLFGPEGAFTGDYLLHILSGGLILGAFFMATDYVTSPLTRSGQIIFGLGCGLITVIIRLWGGYPEGVSYAILMMNAVAPIIDRYTKNRIYGRK